MVWQNDDNEDDKLDDLAKNRGYIIKDKARRRSIIAVSMDERYRISTSQAC